MSKVAIFPAAGNLASNTYKQLVQIIDPTDLMLISRHPEKIPSEYLQKGVTTRKADYDLPESLKHVFDGISCLLLVHKKAIYAARYSTPGVEHIFYTSLAFGGECNPTSVAHVMQAHLKTEQYLKSLTSSASQTSLTFTAIREGLYSESFPMYTGFFDLKAPQGEVKVPHDGSGPGIAWAKIADLGEATANLVKTYMDSPETFQDKNRILLLSGPKSWSIADTLKVTAKVVSKEVKIKLISVEEYANDPLIIEKLGSHGPGEVPKQWSTSFEAVKLGETEVVSGELRKWLGREPEGFEETVRAMVGA
ncbi:hypothetical protein ACLMJK_006074 [Lecanora helva]